MTTVRQFVGPNGTVKNHFIIIEDQGRVKYFQSYDSKIVKIEEGKVTLGRDWKFSLTTSKYRARFLNESTKETQAKLDSGEYLYDEDM